MVEVPTPDVLKTWRAAVIPSSTLAPGTMHSRAHSYAAASAVWIIILARVISNNANSTSIKRGNVTANSTAAAPFLWLRDFRLRSLFIISVSKSVLVG